MQVESGKSLFSQITLTQGNIALMGRTILAAEHQCQRVGVRLSFATPQQFLEINEANRATWLPLASLLNPNFCSLTSKNSIFILGTNSKDEVIACQAGRFYDWDGTNFKDECESLRFWYEDPQAMKNASESATVSAIAARGTTGKIAYSGAAWCRPDYRRLGLVEYLPRLVRAYGAGVWGAATTITLMAETTVKKGVFLRTGYRNIEWGVSVKNNQSGTLGFAYIWTKADEMEQELECFLANLAHPQPFMNRSASG
jgi:hypothetical protein